MQIEIDCVNPPQCVHVEGGLTVDTHIVVEGTLPCHASKFAIDLKESDCPNSNIALHFNPRNNECPDVVVRNSFKDGCWQTEERETPSFPFTAGSSFRIAIFVKCGHYQIDVNDQFYCNFNHRAGFCLQNIKYVCVSEGASYSKIFVHKPC